MRQTLAIAMLKSMLDCFLYYNFNLSASLEDGIPSQYIASLSAELDRPHLFFFSHKVSFSGSNRKNRTFCVSHIASVDFGSQRNK